METKKIAFSPDGLLVPYKMQDGSIASLFVRYESHYNGSVSIRMENPGAPTSKEVFGTILRALYGAEPEFENPAPPMGMIVQESETKEEPKESTATEDSQDS